MRTFAARQAELNERRYSDDASDTRHYDHTTQEGARAILSSRGGKKAAQIALAQLAAQAREPGEGFLPTARLSAPLHVLYALQTIGLIIEADDNRGRAIRFKLTAMGLAYAAKAGGRE